MTASFLPPVSAHRLTEAFLTTLLKAGLCSHFIYRAFPLLKLIYLLVLLLE